MCLDKRSDGLWNIPVQSVLTDLKVISRLRREWVGRHEERACQRIRRGRIGRVSGVTGRLAW